MASQVIIEQSGAGGAGLGGTAPEDPNADTTTGTISTEQQQINGAVTLLPMTVTTLVREYVWGPGDGPGGVDELLVQFATDRAKPWWVLQDGGGDVAALVETPSPGAQSVVAAQWTYDAYGSCLTAEHLRAYPLVHCGHKALFFDRLDVGVVGSSGDEIPRLVPYAHAVYQMRNRAYAPALGRFYQRDPNATAMALIEATAFHGRGLSAIVGAFSMQGLYGDGGNLYQYLGSNPWQGHDPRGLSQDPFDLVDEFIASRAATVAALMNEIVSEAKAVATLTATIVSYLPFPGASFVGDLALAALNGQPLGPVLMTAAIGLFPGGHLALLIGSMATDIASLASARNANEVVDAETQDAIKEFAGDGDSSGDGPAMAGITGRAIASAISQGVSLASIFAQGLGGPADTHVYVGVDSADNVVYVGNSNNPPRRDGEHRRDGRAFTVRPITTQPVTRLQARAIETAVMTKYGSTGGTTIHSQFLAENHIRSISPKRRAFFQAALSWGAQWLSQNHPSLH